MFSIRCRRTLVPVVVIVFFALGGSAPAQEGRTNWVLCLGCPGRQGSRKDHQSPATIKEARRVSGQFKVQEGKLGGRTVAICLTGPEVIRDNVRQALAYIQAHAKSGDRMIGFIDGHGTQDDTEGWVFETYDARTGGPLVTADLRDTLGTLPSRGIEVVLFVHTCHAGALDLRSQGVVVIASSQASEISLGVCARDQFGNVLMAWNLFPEALMEGLDGKADANGDGDVTLIELYTYVARRVAEMKAALAQRYPGEGFGSKPQHVTCNWPRSVRGSLVVVKIGPAQRRPPVTIPAENNPGR